VERYHAARTKAPRESGLAAAAFHTQMMAVYTGE